jgi:hypothetical protein
MQQTQADSLQQTKADPALRSLIEDAVASHSSLKKVLVVDVGALPSGFLPWAREKPDRFSLDQTNASAHGSGVKKPAAD